MIGLYAIGEKPIGYFSLGINQAGQTLSVVEPPTNSVSPGDIVSVGITGIASSLASSAGPIEILSQDSEGVLEFIVPDPGTFGDGSLTFYSAIELTLSDGEDLASFTLVIEPQEGRPYGLIESINAQGVYANDGDVVGMYCQYEVLSGDVVFNVSDGSFSRSVTSSIRYRLYDGTWSQWVTENFEPPGTQAATTVPVITPVGGTSISINEGGAYSDPSWSAADDVGAVLVVWGGDVVDVSTPGVYTRTASATNDVGAATPIDYTVTVAAQAATTVPVITPVGGTSISINEGGAYSDPSWSAADDVGAVLVVWGGDVVDVSTPGVYTRTASATNDVGAATPIDYTVTVVDVVAVSVPTIVPTGSTSVQISLGGTYSDPAWHATDDVGSFLASWSGDVVDTSTLGVYTRTATAANEAGPAEPVDYVVSVVPVIASIAPKIRAVAGASIVLPIGHSYLDPLWWAVDDLSEVELNWSGDIVNTSEAGTYTRIASASNSIGLAIPKQYEVTVIDMPEEIGPMTGAIEILPKPKAGHSPPVLFENNTHLLRLISLTKDLSGIVVIGAQVECTMQVAGLPVPGVLWPVQLLEIVGSPGSYQGVIPASAELSVNDTVQVVFNAQAVDGSIAEWEASLQVRDRQFDV